MALKEFTKKQYIQDTPLDTTQKKVKVLIYDIETSYNIVSSWRVGNKVNLPHNSVIKERQVMCISWKWLDEDEVYTVDWGYNTQDDKYLIDIFVDVLNEADVIVAHNGDNFDLKWLRTRALKHGIEMLPYYNQVDTLQLAKKYFYFNSNKLDYISKFLGFEGKIHTEPELWDKVILGKDLNALCKMIEYCEEDVRQLEKVYKALSKWDKPKQHAGALLFQDKVSSPISGSKNLELVKTTTTPAGGIKRIMRDLDTKRLFEMSDAVYKKYMKEKEKDK
jgi:DNA polymerase III epsilon subunit-like protein